MIGFLRAGRGAFDDVFRGSKDKFSRTFRTTVMISLNVDVFLDVQAHKQGHLGFDFFKDFFDKQHFFF